MTEANIKDMLQHCEKELTTDLYVETKQQLLSHHLNDINKKMLVVLNYLSTKIN